MRVGLKISIPSSTWFFLCHILSSIITTCYLLSPVFTHSIYVLFHLLYTNSSLFILFASFSVFLFYWLCSFFNFENLHISFSYTWRIDWNTVGSRFATVRFTTIHFYDPYRVGPSTLDLWCVTVATQASFLYVVRILALFRCAYVSYFSILVQFF